MRGFQLFKLLTVACVAGLRPRPSAPWLALAMLVAIVPSQAGYRVHEGLLALYDFRLAKGDMFKDRSGSGQPLHLKIENPKNIRRSEGGLEIRGQTLVRSVKPASKISNAVKRSAAITLEAWVRSGNKKQGGRPGSSRFQGTAPIGILPLGRRRIVMTPVFEPLRRATTDCLLLPQNRAA